MDNLPDIRHIETSISVGNVEDVLRIALEDFLRQSKIVYETEDVIELNLEPLFGEDRSKLLNLKYTIQKIKD